MIMRLVKTGDIGNNNEIGKTGDTGSNNEIDKIGDTDRTNETGETKVTAGRHW